MIKFKAGPAPGVVAVVGIGITAKNVEELKKGNPIYIMAADMNLPFDILIMYGETEQQIATELRTHGLIDPERTVIHDTSDKPRTRQ